MPTDTRSPGRTSAGTVCLVTIHGIGFQQAPADGIPGYADDLHRNLVDALDDPSLLSGDPGRDGAIGAIYVASNWPPGQGGTEPGLRRLGTWNASRTAVDGSADSRLTTAGQPLAHVALVYSHLEEIGPKLGSLLQAGDRAALSLTHYASVAGCVRTAFADVLAMVETRRGREQAPSAGLLVRRDIVSGQRHLIPGLFRHPQAAAPQPPGGLIATLRALENDVAAYVCRNDLRERVRSFVREGLLRLAARPDVAGIVVNGHSQGTVVAFDVVSELPPTAGRKVRALVTAGSPLRKYVDLFTWGNEVGGIRGIPWTNYWDPVDPVADPLTPGPEWQPGTPAAPPSGRPGLLRWTDHETGAPSPVDVGDVQVDNIQHSLGGGLQAHNYWENRSQFVEPVAALLKSLIGRAAPAPSPAGVSEPASRTHPAS